MNTEQTCWHVKTKLRRRYYSLPHPQGSRGTCTNPAAPSRTAPPLSGGWRLAACRDCCRSSLRRHQPRATPAQPRSDRDKGHKIALRTRRATLWALQGRARARARVGYNNTLAASRYRDFKSSTERRAALVKKVSLLYSSSNKRVTAFSFVGVRATCATTELSLAEQI